MTPLIIAFTPNYFVPAAVTLRSFLASSSFEGTQKVICLVTEDIPDRQKELLLRISDGRMVFEYLNLAGRLKDVYIDSRYSEAASFRLLLPDILPEYDKVLYIDCDIIVRKDMPALCEGLELGSDYLAAVFEAPIEKQAERFAALGCDPMAYFNSGVLVMNLRQMREEKVSEALIEASKVDYLEFPDQDVLNQVCLGRVRNLPPVYNSIRTFFIPKYRPDFLRSYSNDDWSRVQNEGNIHYTGGKPWNQFTVMFGQWWKVYFSMPEGVKGQWHPSWKVQALARFYCTRFGSSLIDFMQSVYRRLKK